MSEKKLYISPKKYTGKSSILSCRLPDDLISALEEISIRTGRTRNEIIQLCLEYAVDNLEISDKN